MQLLLNREQVQGRMATWKPVVGGVALLGLLGAGGVNTDLLAHLYGFVAGLVLSLPVWLRRGGPGFWSRTHGVPPHPVAEYQMVRTRLPRVRRGGPGPWG